MVSNKRFLIALALYLKGDKLEPALVSDFLNVVPSRVRRKGDEIRSSKGDESFAKTGLWSFRIRREEDALNLSPMISELVSEFGDQAAAAKSAPGVETASLDIFIATDAASSGGSTCEFLLSARDVQDLAAFGIPLSVTVASVVP